MKKRILHRLKWWIAGKELREKNALIALLKEEVSDAKEFAFESALEAARNCPHSLFVHEDSSLVGLEGNVPFCHFYFYSDSGDSSVDIPPRGYWALSDDQTGTELERVLDMRNIKAKEMMYETFDFILHLNRQRNFSEYTFGPGLRTKMVCDHIRKELAEVEAAPCDLEEWIDIALLALDGAWRTGATSEAIAAGLCDKLTENELRTWPDWRTADPDKAIEHTKEAN
ncbi:MAG: dATP/dGTP pyrophosphohydrolase domain-containing protein [Undibacterium umbellatum]|uniref:dATP/dGTP pyrophosphohydrolase domain-containing protein n=1 Tax=Undibacterium umbellatum TaxID=2762300 RepID=UPI003BB7E21F